VNGEGKTLTALNTGVSLAQMGARVLVIDADLRHPHCHAVLKTPKGFGLSEFLTGQRPLAEVIQTTRVDRLFLLSAGIVPPNPAELLGSKRMHAALSFLSHMYDYVVIDAPPLGLVSDALLIAPLVDGVVLVVNSQTTHYEIVQKAHARLAHVRQKVLGVVLNKVDAKSREYGDYYRRYRAYYRQTGEGREEPTHLDMTNHIIAATQSQAVPTKKARKTPRKVEKKEEPRLLENTTPEAKQEENVSSPKELMPEKIQSVSASLMENEEEIKKEVPSHLLH
jgi:capsular exopolysaccharide synthesis family protein